MINVLFKTEEGCKVKVTLDDTCPKDKALIDITILEHTNMMPLNLENFEKQVKSNDLWLSSLHVYNYVDPDLLLNTVTSMYDVNDFTVTLPVHDIRHNVVDHLTLESMESDDPKFSKRIIALWFDKYQIRFVVKIQDLVSALEIITFKKE